MAGGFNRNTRRKVIELPTLTRPTGGVGGSQIQLPKTGLLSYLVLRIAVTIAGSLSAPNALGVASVISRVKLTMNSGVDLINVSGAGYAYLMQELVESEYFLATTQNQGRTAVSATSFNLDMVLPVAVNLRDAVGLVMLQNESTIATLNIDWLADASVATGATVTATVVPYMVIFTVPVSPEDYPDLGLVQQWLEDQQAVSGAGDFQYYWPRGNTYLQVAHGLGIGASGADGFTRAALRMNQSDYVQNTIPGYLDIEHRYLRGRARPAGAVIFDLLGTSGLGNYGTFRDLIDSQQVTDLASILTASGAGTLFTLRRQLVEI